LQVRVLPGPPRFALSGYAWRSRAGTASEAKAKTDWRGTACVSELRGRDLDCPRPAYQTTTRKTALAATGSMN
jgi:hypothetical protein